MLSNALSTPLGDDAMSEDPTVNKPQSTASDMFGKEDALWLPSGTIANLVAIMTHCNELAGDIIVGKASHITRWEGGTLQIWQVYIHVN